jgi:recombination protein RecA
MPTEQELKNKIVNSVYNKLLKIPAINTELIHYNEEEPPVQGYVPVIPDLDRILGGGIPIGRIGEIFGKNAAGKSTLGYHIASAFIKNGGYVVSIDTEHSWDQARAESIGVNREGVILTEANTVEEVFKMIQTIIKSQKDMGPDAPPCLIIVDTIAASPTQAEFNAMQNQAVFQDMGSKAKLLSSWMRQLPRSIGECNISLVFVNQVRQILGALPFQEQFTTTGGEAIKFYSTWRLKVSQISKLKSGDVYYGQKVRIETVKCKTTAPYQKIELDLLYDTGTFDSINSVIEVLKKEKLIKKTAKGIKVTETLVAQGFAELYESEDLFKEFLIEKKELVDQILGTLATEEEATGEKE